MRKKRLIILCSVLSVLAVLIILTSTVFMLTSVKVNFLASGMQVLSENDSESIIKAGKFKYGSNVLFTSYEKQMANIEKSYPYAKVHKVERKFPNKAIVHISERTPAICIKQNGNAYILDSDLKVLNIIYAENLYLEDNGLPAFAKRAPIVTGTALTENITAGDFENNAVLMVQTKCIENGLAKTGRSILDLSSIVITKTAENQLLIKLYVGDNKMYVEICGENSLETKVFNVFGAYFAHLADKEKGDQDGKMYISDELIKNPTFIPAN